MNKREDAAERIFSALILNQGKQEKKKRIVCYLVVLATPIFSVWCLLLLWWLRLLLGGRHRPTVP